MRLPTYTVDMPLVSQCRTVLFWKSQRQWFLIAKFNPCGITPLHRIYHFALRKKRHLVQDSRKSDHCAMRRGRALGQSGQDTKTQILLIKEHRNSIKLQSPPPPPRAVPLVAIQRKRQSSSRAASRVPLKIRATRIGFLRDPQKQVVARTLPHRGEVTDILCEYRAQRNLMVQMIFMVRFSLGRIDQIFGLKICNPA